ncbi:MAG: redox-regulated ATPase YchF [Desulfovibrio sp.]|uniref:redox-regulated ATPase YchF n=1 Tax=Desulfovibrio sp. 7SRBS1 TaxID=3378064 RepID=UPI003B4260E1
MSLSVGIVGLPNVGKSTLFNALSKAQNAESANYAFCTIEPNKAVVPVPDKRMAKLAELVNPQKVIHATVDFWDIAGLVKGASQGEGLGNKFLGNIRETQAILHVCRCFDDDDVIHVHNSVDPLRDIEIIETELILADMQAMERRVERLGKQLKGDKTLKAMLELSQKLLDHLGEGEPASTFAEADTDLGKELLRDVRPLTAKTVIYVANVDEDGLMEDNDHVKKVRELAQQRGAHVVKISAKVEEELVGLSEEEGQEFLDSYGVEESGLDQIIHQGYSALGLISYFTAGEKEVRAWTIQDGWKAPQAAGVIHTDFERGFIRAEVIAYDDYVEKGSEAACRTAGVLRVEGKEYVMKDGDVVHFLFNV